MFRPSQEDIIRPYKKCLQFHKMYAYLTGSHLVTFTVMVILSWTVWSCMDISSGRSAVMMCSIVGVHVPGGM
jgi:hypothetical protein